MNISRRTVLRQLVILAGGVALVPACVNKDSSKASIPLRHLKVNGNEEKMMAELAETILPASNTPGAKDLYLHQFALTMLDDCSSPEDQRKFEEGLKSFDAFAKKEQGAPFAQLNAQQRTALLQQLEKKDGVPPEVQEFYGKAKNLFIQGYVTSQHYLTKVQVYELVPGRYRGCVPGGSDSQVKAPKAV